MVTIDEIPVGRTDGTTLYYKLFNNMFCQVLWLFLNHSIFEYIYSLGTTVCSDEWKAYRSLRNDPSYVHLAVHHSYNFTEVITTNIHTQNIKNSWMQVKWK